MDSQQEAIVYIKDKIQHYKDCKTIQYADFLLALKESQDRSANVLEILIFGECGVVTTHKKARTQLEQFYRFLQQISKEPAMDFQTSDNETDLTMSSNEFVLSNFDEIVAALFSFLSNVSAYKMALLDRLNLLSAEFTRERKLSQQIEMACDRVFSNSNISLTKQQLAEALQCQERFSEKIICYMDRSGDGLLSKEELRDGVVKLLQGDMKTKLDFMFTLFNKNGDGFLSKEELEPILAVCIDESNLSFQDGLASDLADMLWNKMRDTDSDAQNITFDDFYKTLMKYPSIYNSLKTDIISVSESKGLQFRFIPEGRSSQNRSWFRNLKRRCIHTGARFHNNTSLVLWCTLYFIATLLLSIQRINALTPLPVTNTCFVVAKVAGQLLNMNIGLTLLLTLKHTVTKLRRFALIRRVFPFDDFIFLHKCVAYITLGLAIIHSAVHIAQALLTWFLNMQIPFILRSESFLILLTSELLVIFLVCFIVGTRNSFRQKHFDVFFRFHQICAFVWIVLLALHATNFWKWLIGPVVLLAAERVYFLITTCMNKAVIETGAVHGNITKLTIRKPRWFKYKPGDYVNVNIPQISKSQWHAFTISSSPHNETDCFTLHVRKVGSWTGKLHSVVSQMTDQQQLGADNSSFEVTVEKEGMRKVASTTSVSSVSTSSSYDSVPPSYTSASTAVSQYNKSSMFSISGQEFSDNDSVISTAANFSASQTRVDNSKSYTPKFRKAESQSPMHSMRSVDTEGPKTGNLSRASSRLSMITIDMDEAPVLDWTVYVDGPYTTPSREILKTKHAILVAGGIGVTPFTSVLQSVLSMLKQLSRERKCKCCSHKSGNNICRKRTKLEKIDFFWVTRDHAHLAWFQQVFQEIEDIQLSLGLNLINLHIYLTGLKQSTDIQGSFLQLALEMAYEEENLDIVSGLKSRTKPGRPNWSKVLPNIITNNSVAAESKPKVYVCGPKALCSDLKKECYRNNIIYKEEVF